VKYTHPCKSKAHSGWLWYCHVGLRGERPTWGDLVFVWLMLFFLFTSIEEAAVDLGYTPLKTFFVVTLPVINPALASGWLLALTLSLGDLVTASFMSGPGATTLPMVVFSSVRLGVSPKINALATLIILAVSLVAFLAWYIMRRNKKRQRSGRLS
jgi:putrescine transport system permease protein